MGSVKVYYDGIVVFLQIDFIEDLKSIMIFVFVMYGDDDQIVFYVDFGLLLVKFVWNSMLKIYKGFLYGMFMFNVDMINVDLFVFL